MDEKRVFIGSFVQDESLKKYFEKYKKALQDEAKIKWTKTPDNLHLTWHFFGNMPLEKIQKLQQILQDILPDELNIPVEINSITYFSRKGKPAVLYAAIDEKDTVLQKLFQQIQQALYKSGLIAEPKNRFVPHITFGRIKKVNSGFKDKIALINQNFKPVSVNISKPEIIESILQPDGALYKAIQK